MDKIRGVLVLAIFGGLGIACGANDPGTGQVSEAVSQAESLTITPVTPSQPPPCPPANPNEACFTVQSSGDNITHIFVDADQCPATLAPSLPVVLADGVPQDLHTQGEGPCHDLFGDDTPLNEGWFPLPGNQSNVTICVCTDTHAIVTVGAKADNDCVAGPSTSECKKKVVLP
jgi:hypothetical protein